MPAGDDVAVPVPVPSFTTVSCRVSIVNIAVAVVVPIIVTLQVSPGITVVLVVVHPVHVVKIDPIAGVATNVTGVPLT